MASSDHQRHRAKQNIVPVDCIANAVRLHPYPVVNFEFSESSLTLNKAQTMLNLARYLPLLEVNQAVVCLVL